MKNLGCLIFATAALLFVTALPADAQAGGKNHGFKGHSTRGFSFKAHSNRGFKGHQHQAHRFHHRPHFRSKVFVGVGVGLGSAWWWGWPGYYPYPAYAAPVVIQQSPPVYIQQDTPAEPYYWYYCESAQAYYPYVQQCPNGWMKVVPPTDGPKPD
ncbi:MAG: hypothetical protein ACREJV_04900 [Candidatus Rokuibacteriota bacterium]